jgi:hypothetical protein
MKPIKCKSKWGFCVRLAGGRWRVGDSREKSEEVTAPDSNAIPMKIDGRWFWVWPEGVEPEAGEDDGL